jgi:hypothetical protein
MQLTALDIHHATDIVDTHAACPSHNPRARVLLHILLNTHLKPLALHSVLFASRAVTKPDLSWVSAVT